jgi:hypothetical protein
MQDVQKVAAEMVVGASILLFLENNRIDPKSLLCLVSEDILKDLAGEQRYVLGIRKKLKFRFQGVHLIKDDDMGPGTCRTVVLQ